ncbi:ABC transporter permease [Moorellaceae bacterium AZ2]
MVNPAETIRWRGLRRWLLETQVGISILSVVLSLIALAVMALIYGAQPLYVLLCLFEGALRGKQAVISTMVEMAPLILTGLAVLLPYKAGFFNIGGQGQLEIGAIAAVLVATTLKSHPVVVIILSALAAIAVGVIAILPPLILRIQRGASEVTTTIMMNFACVNLVYALVTGAMKDPRAFYGATKTIASAYRLPLVPEALGVHVGVWAAVVVALAVYWVMKSTVFGLQLKAVGYNEKAAKVAGISVEKILALSVLGGGAFAGLAGAIQVLGVTGRVAEGWSMPWGFTGITVAFLGGNALGVIPVAFLLSILETGARYMQAMTGVPAALVSVMQGVPVLLFVCFNARKIITSRVTPAA